ncbi:hypothetical protein L210DRAFT_3518039 [Boletus edulis BED1]|uniref:Secreted protein n=1 Tax=Boletus edulis BED1 TaxID=1328754 RepID=A0AAD4C9S8_BOLED|nr:hypothetical protein L210DRAFT_3518039 [Boletus edulis BED1]
MTRTMFLIMMTGLPISVAAMWTMTITMTELPMSATTNLHRSSSLVSSLSLSDPSPLLHPRPRPRPRPLPTRTSLPPGPISHRYTTTLQKPMNAPPARQNATPTAHAPKPSPS